jgi:mannose-1-phosphate guanylyltransferase/phosphomannomutase
MKAVIMAGGQGSRLRPLTENLPKPMVHVLGQPIMEHIIRHLARYGIEEIVTTLHYRPRQIQNYFGDGSNLDITMHYTLETEPLGTAGSVKLGQKYLDETFLVVGGDALMDFDIAEFLAFHRRSGAKVSLLMKRVKEPGEFGIVITGSDGRVQRFLEKPGPGEVFSDTVNTGIYLIEPEVLDLVPEGEPFDFAHDLFPLLMQQNEPIYGYVGEGYWSDIGTLEQLRQAHWDFLDGRVQLDMPGSLIQEGVWVGKDTYIDPAAKINGPCWLGDSVDVHKHASIGPYAVLGHNTEVDSLANLNRAIVMENSFVGERSDLRNCIVGPRNLIEAECELGDGCVIGPDCRLGRRVVVQPNVLVWPEKAVDVGVVIMENLVWESLQRPSIFGSRGISGLANLYVTPEFAATLGKAFGAWAKQGRRVVASRDAHPFSRLIKRAFVSGLLSVGVDVDDLEESTIPVTRFITGSMEGHSGGVHIGISDTHPQVVQIEMYTPEGLPLPRSARRKIEAGFYRADFPRVSMDHVGTLRYPGRVDDRYIDYIMPLIAGDSPREGQNIVYFCYGRSTAKILTRLFSSYGVPNFRLGNIPDQSGEDVVHQISSISKLNHAIGMIFQPAAEHLQLVDESGQLLSLERTTELLAAAFIQSAPSDLPVFLPADHPAFLASMAERHKRQIIVTRMEPAALLAEAASQHAYSQWLDFIHFYLGFDAVPAAIQLLNFLRREKVSLHDFNRSVPTSDRERFFVGCAWEEMGRVMRELVSLPEADINAVPEGVRLKYERGTVYVLPSADRPELLVSIEANSMSEMNGLREEVSRQLQSMAG